MDRVLRIARRIGASPQRVFDAWIDAGIARRWLFATACRPLASVTIDTRVRGSFELIDEREVAIVEGLLEQATRTLCRIH